MSRTFTEDYAFGTQKEDDITITLNNFFNDELVKPENKKSKYDFKGKETYYEVKSRTNSYNQYPTTMIAQNKIFTDNQIFVFNFTDGIYYIKYDKEIFDTFERKPFKRAGRPDIKTFESLYIYIPIEQLTKIKI